MRRTLLVPLDGLPLAETALPMANLLAEIIGAELDLVRVVPADAPAALESQAGNYLGRIASTLAPHQVQTHVMRGKAAECLVREAAAEHVSMTAMATHARSGVNRAVLGSVAEYVVAHAPTPTLLVPVGTCHQPRLKTILVAIDPTCAAPLATVIELVRAAGAHVVLLRVVAPEDTSIWQWQPGPLLDAPQVVVAARRDLGDIASALGAQGVSAEARVVIGSAVTSINSVATAIDADLIVVSTHARTGAQRLVQGSVSDAVVRTAHRPVLVCRLIPPPPGQVRQIDLFHTLQRRAPRSRALSIADPLVTVPRAPQ
jgi:nucleotide-binding universal stress UspA family protein